MQCLWKIASILKNKSLMVVPIAAVLRGSRIDCGIGWKQAQAANWIERQDTGTGKREKKNLPIRAGLLVGCLFRIRPFSNRVFD